MAEIEEFDNIKIFARMISKIVINDLKQESEKDIKKIKKDLKKIKKKMRKLSKKTNKKKASIENNKKFK